MSDKNKTNCSKCQCENCCKLIPESTGLTFEGSDYIRHFCGDECYETWKTGKPKTFEERDDESI